MLMRLMWAATLLLLLAGKAAGLVAAPPRQAGAARCVAPRPRAPPPRAVLADPAAAAALAAAAVQPLPLATTTLLAADMFGKTFLAGISIAAATLVRPPPPCPRPPHSALARRLPCSPGRAACQMYISDLCTYLALRHSTPAHIT